MKLEQIQKKRMDNSNKKCKFCKKGTYIETSIHDDLHGVLHCSKCKQQINRYENKKDKL
jgi:hypothetical protein